MNWNIRYGLNFLKKDVIKKKSGKTQANVSKVSDCL